MTKNESKLFLKTSSNFSAIFEPYDSYETDPCKKLVLNRVLWLLQDILQYNICSPLHLNKTAQRNLQNCTKPNKKVHNMLHNKIY